MPASRSVPDVVKKRKSWSDRISGFKVSDLVFGDESGCNTDRTRRYAYSLGGSRAVDSIEIIPAYAETLTFRRLTEHLAASTPPGQRIPRNPAGRAEPIPAGANMRPGGKRKRWSVRFSSRDAGELLSDCLPLAQIGAPPA